MLMTKHLRLYLLALSLAVLCIAIFNPNSKTISKDTRCPMGYGGKAGEGALPPDHPPVPGYFQGSPIKAVFYNATVWTGELEVPWVTAFAVSETGRIACIGNDSHVLRSASPSARHIDLQGRFISPGFMDPHIHMLSGGLTLEAPDLRSAKSREQFSLILGKACGEKKEGEWVVGWGWDEANWGGQLPDLTWLDCPANPVMVSRIDDHMVLANAVALQLAAISADSPDPPGGKIHRLSDGSPSGLLADDAAALVRRKLARLTPLQKQAALLRAADYLLSRGVTMVHDMGRGPFSEEQAWADFEEAYLALAEGARLPLRVLSMMPLCSWERLARYVEENGTQHPGGRLYWGVLKEFADGSLGSRTALFHQAYADEPSSRGLSTADPTLLEQRVLSAHMAGLQVAIHAIGDKAVDDMAGLYARLPTLASQARQQGSSEAEGGTAGGGWKHNDGDGGGKVGLHRLGHRIEHVQHISGEETARLLADVGTWAVVNPLHLPLDVANLVPRLGEERAGAGHSYAFSTLDRAGVKLAFASDWPVVASEPMEGIHVAVHRAAPGGEALPHAPEEAFHAESALRATTEAGARLSGLDDELGTLRVGKRADFVVLSDNPITTVPGAPLPHVMQTYVDGLCAFGCGENRT
eukprot:jgi/Botrbrau1/8135/Bobra.0308s0027.1